MSLELLLVRSDWMMCTVKATAGIDQGDLVKLQPVPCHHVHANFTLTLEQKQALFEISWKTFHLEAAQLGPPSFLCYFLPCFLDGGLTVWPVLDLGF